MRIKLQNELIPLNILVVLLIVIITLFPSNVLRIILGIPFILFFTGYTLTSALFPKKNDLDSTQRVALSFGLSFAVVALIGLIINYTPWGIGLYPILISLTIFIIAASAVAWYRRQRLAEGERLVISFNLTVLPWKGQGTLDRILSVVLIMVIVGAIGTMGYVIVTPKAGQSFTEFYVLGLEGKAGETAGYPTELVVGEEGKLVVGIINNEFKTVGYRIEVRIDGVKNNEVGGIRLEHGEKWEHEVGLTPDVAGEKQKVEFLLYKGGEAEPYSKPLRLWVDVKE